MSLPKQVAHAGEDATIEGIVADHKAEMAMFASDAEGLPTSSQQMHRGLASRHRERLSHDHGGIALQVSQEHSNDE
eukprot:1751907-Heterocapsa_arctica.AAC.1